APSKHGKFWGRLFGRNARSEPLPSLPPNRPPADGGPSAPHLLVMFALAATRAKWCLMTHHEHSHLLALLFDRLAFNLSALPHPPSLSAAVFALFPV
ncbi:hypothetical protein COCVIDRAFT_92313, partial [Bipolaris victoriae FI3]